jgi:hypothetical protein
MLEKEDDESADDENMEWIFPKFFFSEW